MEALQSRFTAVSITDRPLWLLCNEFAEVVISKPAFEAGRSSSMDLVCDSQMISRNHALFILCPDDGTLHVQDNESCNGTYINCKRIVPNKLHELHENDEVGLGLHSRLNFTLHDLENLKCIFTVRRLS